MRLDRRIRKKVGSKVGGRKPPLKSSPTPILISPRLMAFIAVLGLAVFAFALYAAPIVPIVALGGTALAIVLSFPVGALSRVMPRWLAVLVTFLVLSGLFALALVFLVPLLIEQLSALIQLTPAIANAANRFLLDVLGWLDERNLLGGATPDEFVAGLVDDLFNRARALSENLLSSLVGFISGAFNFGIALFGVIFVAVYLLADVRKVKAAYLRAAPVRYRRDALELWNAFGLSLSRYLGGLIIVVVIEGTLVGVALYLLGVPYALLLGAWVSATAIIPYLGVFLGAIPAIILASFESPTTAVLTVIVYVAIQQLEGNVLTPRIQGQALHVHPIIVLLAVIGGGELAGLAGVIFAVPALAVSRVFFDFFRARIQTSPKAGP
jgi:predicted PurR-regulated permease PerM